MNSDIISNRISGKNCLILSQATSFLSWGSHMMHGSHTSLGGTADVKGIAIVSLLAQQIMVDNLGNSTILLDLSSTKRYNFLRQYNSMS
jgi:hypothetical protein